MMRTRQIIVILLSFLVTTILKAQDHSFRLEGKVTVPDCDTVVIYNYPYYIPFSGKTYKRIVLPLKEGRFSIQLKPSSTPAPYFSLVICPLIKGRERSLMKARNVFLAKADDDLFVRVDSSKVTFSGKGSTKYNALVKADRVTATSPFSGTINSIVGGSDGKQKLDQIENFLDSLYERKLTVIAQDSALMEKDEYEILKFDLLANRKLNFLNTLQLNLSLLGEKDSVTIRNYILKFREQYGDFQPDSSEGDKKAYAPYYAEYLLKAIGCKYALEYGDYLAFGSGYEKEGYDYLKNQLTGLLRDKALALYVFKNRRRLEEAGGLHDVCSDIKTPYFKSLICRWLSQGVEGEKMRDFVLADTLGHEISLEEFSGKVTLIDFWYTGCGGCARLSSQLGRLIESLGDRADFLFVTVSIDKNKHRWKESVKHGKYTHGADINLYTNGRGTDHQIIKYFDIMSYPRLILIDRSGYIISADLVPKSAAIVDEVKKALNRH